MKHLDSTNTTADSGNGPDSSPRDRRALTSAANGTKSKGPKTETGKRKSAANSLKHGLYSRDIVLACESREEFAALTDYYIGTYEPANPEEHDLVTDMIHARWFIRRAERHEKALLHLEMARALEKAEKEFDACKSDTLEALALVSLAESRALENVNRMAQRYERTYHRSKHALTAMRRPQPDPEAQPCTDSEPAAETQPAPEPSKPAAGGGNEPTATRRWFPFLTLVLLACFLAACFRDDAPVSAPAGPPALALVSQRMASSVYCGGAAAPNIPWLEYSNGTMRYRNTIP